MKMWAPILIFAWLVGAAAVDQEDYLNKIFLAVVCIMLVAWSFWDYRNEEKPKA